MKCSLLAHLEEVAFKTLDHPQHPTSVQEDTGILAQLKHFLTRHGGDDSSPHYPEPELRPPYPAEIANFPYSTGYKTPKFRLFDRRAGNPHEHVKRFSEHLGAHYNYNYGYRNFRNLKLKRLTLGTRTC